MSDASGSTVGPDRLRSRIPRIVGGTMLLVAIAAALYLQLQRTAAELGRWQLVETELGVSLPEASRYVQTVHESGAAMACICAAAMLLGLLALAWCSQTRLRSTLWVAAVVLIGVITAMALFRATSGLDDWMAHEMEIDPPLTPSRVDEEIDTIEDISSSPVDVHRAARTIRAVGLKHAAGLLTIDQSTVDSLIAVAGDDARLAHVRMSSAWSVMPIDEESPQACEAIAAAIRAALESDDAVAKEVAGRYTDHPCLTASREDDQ